MSEAITENQTVTFLTVLKINSILIDVWREKLHDVAQDGYKTYLEVFKLHDVIALLACQEQSYKLAETRANNDNDRQKALADCLIKSQHILNELKLIALDSRLEDLQKLELKLLIALRDIRKTQAAAKAIATEVDTITHQINTLHL